MNKRLKQFLKFKDIAVSDVERKLNLGNGTLSRPLRAGGTIGSDKVEKILQLYPDLSAEWLLRGDGTMLKSLSTTEEINGIPASELITALQSQIDTLTQEKQSYWELITKLASK